MDHRAIFLNNGYSGFDERNCGFDYRCRDLIMFCNNEWCGNQDIRMVLEKRAIKFQHLFRKESLKGLIRSHAFMNYESSSDPINIIIYLITNVVNRSYGLRGGGRIKVVLQTTGKFKQLSIIAKGIFKRG